MEKTLKQSELKEYESWPKNTQKKDNYMTNHADSKDIPTDQEKN